MKKLDIAVAVILAILLLPNFFELIFIDIANIIFVFIDRPDKWGIASALLGLFRGFFIFSMYWCLVKYPKTPFKIPRYILAGIIIGEIATLLLCYDIWASLNEHPDEPPLDMLIFIPAAISAGVGTIMLLLIWVKSRQPLLEEGKV